MPNPTQQSVILLPGGVERTTTPTVGVVPADMRTLTNIPRFKGAHILLDVTVLNTTPDVNVEIEGFDFGSSTWYNILTGASVSTVSFNIYKVHPDLTAAANLIAKDGIPYLWRVRVVHDNAEGIEYSLGVNYLD